MQFQVNGKRLLGLNHVDVVSILKELPQHVRIVCCRKKETPVVSDMSYAQHRDQFFQSPAGGAAAASPAVGVVSPAQAGSEVSAASPAVIPAQSGASPAVASRTTYESGAAATPVAVQSAVLADRLVKAKSEQSLPSSASPAMDLDGKNKSRSLEPLTGLAMWSTDLVEVQLQKGDRGLGFSILDYQVTSCTLC